MHLLTTRRTFLKSVSIAGLGVVGAYSRLAGAESPRDGNSRAAAQINFGFSLYGMRGLKLADALKVCAMVGYDSVELVATKGWPCDPSPLSTSARGDIRKQLEDLGLAMPAVMENLHAVVDRRRHRENLDRLQRAAELGHDVSPQRAPVIETVLGGRSHEWETLKGKMVAALRDWAEVGEAAETVIAVKAHIGGALSRPADAKWLVDEVASPSVRLAYDYSHFQLAGFELADSLKTMLGQSVFIHVKDKTGSRDKFQFLLPGDGEIDYRRYFGLLRASSYRGAVIVEVSGQIHGKPGYDAVAAARKSYANLSPLLKASGLRG